MKEMILRWILEHPGCNARDVAREFHIEPEVAADVVDSLLVEGKLELS